MLFALVLHVGNITFVTGEWPVRGDPESPPQPGARVANSDVLTRVAALLQATPAEVECAVCTKIIVVKEGDIEKPLEERLALQQRNSLAMHLYSLCFDWCVQLTNEAIGAPEGRTAVAIGVLDIFGFENFATTPGGVNSFAQLCINLTNERLHGLFIEHVMHLEQEVYVREEINWRMIKYKTNSATIDLIEKHRPSIFSLIVDATAANGKDGALLQTLHQTFTEPKLMKALERTYVQPKAGATFGVRHYAGEVVYTISGFVAKNKDEISTTISTLLESKTGSDALRTLAKTDAASKAATSKAAKRPGGKKSRKSVCESFSASLEKLIGRLNKTDHSYIRCLKPNQTLRAGEWESTFMESQLSYSGALEVTKVRQAGLNVREPLKTFYAKYKLCAKNAALTRGASMREQTRRVLEQLQTVFIKSDEGKVVSISTTEAGVEVDVAGSKRMVQRFGETRPPATVRDDRITSIEEPTRDADGTLLTPGTVTLAKGGSFDNPYDIAAENVWRVGKSTVFFETELIIDHLMAIREARKGEYATIAQSILRGIRPRREYRRTIDKVTKLQSKFRAFDTKVAFREVRKKALLVQQHFLLAKAAREANAEGEAFLNEESSVPIDRVYRFLARRELERELAGEPTGASPLGREESSRSSIGFGSSRSRNKRTASRASLINPLARAASGVMASRGEGMNESLRMEAIRQQARAFVAKTKAISDEEVVTRASELEDELSHAEALARLREQNQRLLRMYAFAKNVFDHRDEVYRSRTAQPKSEVLHDKDEQVPLFERSRDKEGWLYARTNDNHISWHVFARLRHGTLSLTFDGAGQEGEPPTVADHPAGHYPLALWRVALQPSVTAHASSSSLLRRGVSEARKLITNKRSSMRNEREVHLELVQPLVGRDRIDDDGDGSGQHASQLLRGVTRGMLSYMHQAEATLPTSVAAAEADEQAAAPSSMRSAVQSLLGVGSGAAQAGGAGRTALPAVHSLTLSFEPHDPTRGGQNARASADGARAPSPPPLRPPPLGPVPSLKLNLGEPGSMDTSVQEKAVEWSRALTHAEEQSGRVDDFCIRQTDAARAHEEEQAAKRARAAAATSGGLLAAEAEGRAEGAAAFDETESEEDDEIDEVSMRKKRGEVREERRFIVVREGYLLRRTVADQTWARRYFVLTSDGRLSWYTSAGAISPYLPTPATPP